MKLFITLTLLGSIIVGNVNAGSIPWSKESWTHYSDGEDIRSILKDIAVGSGFNISISEQVVGEVNGGFDETSYENAFNTLVRMFGLTSFYDGSILWISKIEEVESATIKLENISVDQFKRKLSELGILDTRHSWSELRNEGIIYIAGPSRYVELVSSLAIELNSFNENVPAPIYKHVDSNGVMHFSDEPEFVVSNSDTDVLPSIGSLSSANKVGWSQ